MKKLLALILVLCPILAFGQYVNPTPDYQFKGQVSVGTDTDAYVPSPTNSWLTVGPDSTNKGLILPRVVDTSDVTNPVLGMHVFQIKDSTDYYWNGAWESIKGPSNRFILNQDSIKQVAVSRYNKSTVDSISNQKTPSFPFDFRSGSNLFQWDGLRLNLKTPSSGLNIGNLAGYQNENSYQSIHIGQFSAFSSVGDSNSVTIGTGASEGSNGNYTTTVGNASAFLAQGSFSTSLGYQASHNTGNTNNSIFVGFNAGYGTNSSNSIYIGNASGANFNVTDSIFSANGKSTVDKVNATNWHGTSVQDFIANNSLSINGFYPAYLYYFGTKPNGDSANPYVGPIRVVSDSSIDIFGVIYTDFGSGDFVISINNDAKDNQIVIGNGAMADSSNQAVLGNNSTTQIKFGGAGGVRIKTSATYTQGQSPVWDSASHQLIPGVANTPNISFWIPSVTYSVDSVQSNLYFENIVYSDFGKNDLTYRSICSKGRQMDRGFQITPALSDTGKYSLNTQVWYGHSMISQSNDSLFISSKSSGSGTRNIVMVGNSLMAGGQIVDTLMADYGGGSLLFNFQGTVPTTGGYATEGHSGWRWVDFATSGRTAYQLTVSGITDNPSIGDIYTTNGSTFQIFGENISGGSGDIEFQIISGTNAPIVSGGTLIKSSGSGDPSIAYSSSTDIPGNPFWNPSTSRIDLDYYKTTNSITLNSGDWVTFELGINDFASLTSESAAIAELNQVYIYIDTLINEFQRDVPGLRIAIMLPAPGFNQDGFGINYNTSIVRWRYDWNLNIYETGIISKYDNNTYKDRNVYVVGMGNNMDIVNNSIQSDEPVNSRNPTTYKQTQNAVHPSNYGYAQYSDVYYGLFKWFK